MLLWVVGRLGVGPIVAKAWIGEWVGIYVQWNGGDGG